jgi:hypothetical protein
MQLVRKARRVVANPEAGRIADSCGIAERPRSSAQRTGVQRRTPEGARKATVADRLLQHLLGRRPCDVRNTARKRSVRFFVEVFGLAGTLQRVVPFDGHQATGVATAREAVQTWSFGRFSEGPAGATDRALVRALRRTSVIAMQVEVGRRTARRLDRCADGLARPRETGIDVGKLLVRVKA